MIGISSRSAGVLILPKPGTDEYAVLDVVEGKEQDPVEANYLYSSLQDWEELQGADKESLLETVSQEFWLARTVSLFREVIGGLESSLKGRVLEYIEELLGSRVSSEETLNRLLIAPLVNLQSLESLAKSALSQGFSAVGSIIDELKELQPLLRRLTDLWLSLDEVSFRDIPESKETIWITMVEKCDMRRLLKAGNVTDFTTQWNLLAFHFKSPLSRAGITALARELSERLFRHYKRSEITLGTVPKEEEVVPRKDDVQGIGYYERFESVQKQIAAIAQAVSQGNDSKAEKFLRELIEQQISFSDGVSYALKSLCNIAQQCADMYRMDFEILCLDKANELDPTDTWTHIQYGDHLKRIGKYDEALKVFAQTDQPGENYIVQASIADVYSQQGDYARAIQEYKAIEAWDEKFDVRLAIADILRKMGQLDKSEALYRELIYLAHKGLTGIMFSDVRTQVGLAEIAKKRGKLEDASQIYYEILKRDGIEDRDRIIYKQGLCNILKLMDHFEEAYKIVDECVQQYPFAMQARFIRGSILGLIGQELDGLKDLPESSGSRSYGEWLRHYYRGLLLLKLERYEDAMKCLIEELPKAIAFGEEKSIIRMGAALCYLGKNENIKADKVLSEIPDLHDCHVQYLSLVLKLHLATQKKDLAKIKSLKECIDRLQVVNANLEKAVEALGKKDFSLALTCETNALLKLAA